METEIEELCITVGYSCNFHCDHCAVKNKRGVSLTEAEKLSLIRIIKKRHIPALFFVGGETSLYIKDINRILDAVFPEIKPKVRITTNGYFADSVENAVKTLKRFRLLSGVQLSYDKYHSRFMPLRKVKNLYLACRDLKIPFSCILSIASPMDLMLLNDLKRLGKFRVAIQPVHPIGAAEEHGLDFQYPSFDPGVLKKYCPNRGRLIYLCGEGFTICCSYLSLQKDSSKYVHPTISAHKRSRFYKLVANNTFGSMMSVKGISTGDLLPKDSSPCNLCSRIFLGA